jgi:hypothetical protein
MPAWGQRKPSGKFSRVAHPLQCGRSLSACSNGSPSPILLQNSDLAQARNFACPLSPIARLRHEGIEAHAENLAQEPHNAFAPASSEIAPLQTQTAKIEQQAARGFCNSISKERTFTGSIAPALAVSGNTESGRGITLRVVAVGNVDRRTSTSAGSGPRAAAKLALCSIRALPDVAGISGRSSQQSCTHSSALPTTSLRRYQNRAIEAAKVIEELIALAKDMREADRRGEALGLTPEEAAFYDALETNDSAVKVLGDEALRLIAREVTAAVRANVRINWMVREDVRAHLRVTVKRVLRKYGYPPDLQEKRRRRCWRRPSWSRPNGRRDRRRMYDLACPTQRQLAWLALRQERLAACGVCR